MEPWDPLSHPPLIQVRKQESDSEEEGGLGNVTRVVIRPPGHSGKAKRGHLSFDASFEGGNLGRVDFISEFEYDLFIRPDTCNPRFRFWFNFVVDNVRCDQRVVFNVVNLHKTKTLYRSGMTPLVRTSSRPRWQRLNGTYVYYHKSPEHRTHYILSFAFVFDREEDVFQFAACFPYSYSRAEAHLTAVLKRQLPFVRHQTLAFSLQQRRLNLLTIGGLGLSTGTGLSHGEVTVQRTPGPGIGPNRRCKVVVIMARSHPGETPSSFVVHGLIDFMLSSHIVATAIRDHVQLHVIPMVNPDGVFMGNHKSSLMGYDLNRQWNQISVYAHPTIAAIKSHLLQVTSNKSLELDMVIDVHAHSSLLGSFIYGNSYDDVYRFERHILFPKLLAHNTPDFNTVQTMYNRDPNKAATARRYLCDILPSSVNVYTLQVSIYGYQQPKTGALVPYTEDAYFRLGRNLARTIFDYYKATGIIPQTIVAPNEIGASSLGHGGGGRSSAQPVIKRKEKQKSKSIRVRSQGKGHDEIQNGKPSLHLSPLKATSSISSSASSDSEDNSTSRASTPSQDHDELNSPTSGTLLNPAATTATTGSSTPSSITSRARVGRSRSRVAKELSLDSIGEPLHMERDASVVGNQPILRFAKSASCKPALLPTKCKTFDFSCLSYHAAKTHSKTGANGTRQKLKEKRSLMERRREMRLFGSVRARRPAAGCQSNDGAAAVTPAAGGKYRKIGGGGIIVHEKKRRGVKWSRKSHPKTGGLGGSDFQPPFLTIIDLSALSMSLHFDSRKRVRGTATNHDHEGGGGKMRTRGDGRGAEAELEHLKRLGKLNRRRRAVLFRDYVTDCSPWDDADEDTGGEGTRTGANLDEGDRIGLDKQMKRAGSETTTAEVPHMYAYGAGAETETGTGSDSDGYYSAPPHVTASATGPM